MPLTCSRLEKEHVPHHVCMVIACGGHGLGARHSRFRSIQMQPTFARSVADGLDGLGLRLSINLIKHGRAKHPILPVHLREKLSNVCGLDVKCAFSLVSLWCLFPSKTTRKQTRTRSALPRKRTPKPQCKPIVGPQVTQAGTRQGMRQ